MPLPIPTRDAEVKKLQAYVRRELRQLDPTVTRRRGFIGGFVRSIGSALHDWYVSLKRYADNEPFPQTASEGFFSQGWWVDITNLQRLTATAARGRIVLTGVDGTVVPEGSGLSSGGRTYTTDAAVVVTAQSLVGTSVAYKPLVGRFVTLEPHNLATGVEATISGGVDASLNGTFALRVVDAYTLEYDLETPLSGIALEPNPVLSATWANATITCGETGIDGNIDAIDVELSVLTPPTGLDAVAKLTYGGVADGTDEEGLEAWRARVLEALGTDFGMFSAAEIEIVAKTVPGVSRVFVRQPRRRVYDADGVQVFDGVGADGYPTEGRCRIAFLRDDADPIPTAFEVERVREVIHGLLVPAHTYPDDVEVLAPERYPLQVRFRSISPDTPGMRTSIRAAIEQHLRETATWGGVLEIEALRCAIRSAYDPETGQGLSAYELDSPTLDIPLPVDAYPVLVSITWRVTT